MNNEDHILELCDAFQKAHDRCLQVDAEVARLAAEGDHKKKNKIIHTEGVKASQRRNMALRKLVEALESDS